MKFIGEEAEDAGGVKKEFFMLLIKEILNPKFGMFVNYNDTNMMWFNDSSFEDVKMYYLIGKNHFFAFILHLKICIYSFIYISLGLMCGLAIYNFTIIDLPFPLALYKKLLNEPVTLSDLLDLDPMMVW